MFFCGVVDSSYFVCLVACAAACFEYLLWWVCVGGFCFFSRLLAKRVCEGQRVLQHAPLPQFLCLVLSSVACRRCLVCVFIHMVLMGLAVLSCAHVRLRSAGHRSASILAYEARVPTQFALPFPFPSFCQHGRCPCWSPSPRRSH